MKTIQKKVEIKETKKEECCNREELVSLLKRSVPNLFDRIPNGSLSDSGLAKLAEEICHLLK
jgi:hypothetical protein